MGQTRKSLTMEIELIRRVASKKNTAKNNLSGISARTFQGFMSDDLTDYDVSAIMKVDAGRLAFRDIGAVCPILWAVTGSGKEEVP